MRITKTRLLSRLKINRKNRFKKCRFKKILTQTNLIMIQKTIRTFRTFQKELINEIVYL